MGHNLLINGVYWGYNPLILTIDPNFLGHPSIVVLSKMFLFVKVPENLPTKNFQPQKLLVWGGRVGGGNSKHVFLNFTPTLGFKAV